ncbi:hypothetical protein B5P44_16300 [Mycobacterium sp. CBMA 213]|nr:hypothetical protein [Mycolicibacterium sp. CBMA 213]
MFNKNKWVKAEGVVVAVDRQHDTYSGGGPAEEVWGYVVDVEPSDGPQFRAQVWPGGTNVPGFHSESSHFRRPVEGQTVAVEYVPGTKKVRFDMSDQRMTKQTRHETTVEAHHAYTEALGSPVGTPAAEAGGQVRIISAANANLGGLGP